MKKLTLTGVFGLLLCYYGYSQSQRLVLVEHFTQASCGPCASANPTLQATMSANSTKAIKLTHQVSWPGSDPMNAHYPAGPQARASFYGVQGVPNSVLDGTSGPGAPNSVVTTSTINTRYAVSSPFTIDVQFTLNGGDINATMDIACTQAVTGNLVAHIAVIEKHINFSSSPGSNGETQFHNVLKQYLPSTSGTNLASSWTVGQTQSINESWTLSNVYDPNELAVIAFIQDASTKEVHQAGYASTVAPTLPNEAGILSIDNGGNQCSGTYTPQITLKNYGANDLTSATINYDIDGGANQIYNWTGTLSSGASTTISLNPITVSPGYHTFNSSTSNPNGTTDSNTANDAASSPITIGSESINLVLTTDCYGTETSWEVKDSGGNIWSSGEGYSNVPGGETINQNMCLLPGTCYDFVINDTYGDGMYGSQWNTCSVNGNYEINQGSTQLATMLATNSDFGNQETNNFCIPTPMVANFSASTNNICNGSTVTYSDMSSGSTSWNWTFPGGTPATSTSQNPTVTYTSAGSYNATLTASNGTSTDTYTSSTPITVNATPSITTGTVNSPTSCGSATGSIQVNGSGTGTLSWTGTGNGNLTNTSLPHTITALAAGSYNITYTDATGCASNLLAESLNDPNPPATPTISASGALTFCDGDHVILTSSANSGNMWSSNDNTNTITVTNSGTYSVTYTDANGCSATSAPTTVIVNNNPNAPTIVAGGPTTFCEGNNVTLTSSEGTGNIWSNSETTQNIDIIASGTYTVTYTDANGCSATSAPTTVTVNPLPNVDFTSIDDVCVQDASFALTQGSPSGGYYSGTGVSSDFFDPNTAQAGTHTITYTYTDGNGCENSASTDLVVDDCAGLENLHAMGYAMYPNPTEDFLIIHRDDNALEADVLIFDINGKLVYNKTVKNNTLKIAVDEWTPGSYIVKLLINEHPYTQQILVK